MSDEEETSFARLLEIEGEGEEKWRKGFPRGTGLRGRTTGVRRNGQAA